MKSLLLVLAMLLMVPTALLADAETVKQWTQDDARILVEKPADFDEKKPTLLLIYLQPNGSTIEMTAGCKLEPGMDWHFDIQHIAAQTRRLREIDTTRNIVLAYIEANAKTYKLTWPTWRKEKGAENGKIIRKLIDDVEKSLAPSRPTITLASHSGGGSFIFGYLNGGDTIPDNVEHIIWMDSNYAYDEADHHGEKLLKWLKGDPNRHVIVLAYNDRAATLNGKPFVSETGGTFYRSHKMVEYFNGAGATLARNDHEPFEDYVGLKGQIHLLLHTNPEKKILHTVLVERNGLLETMTWNTPLHDKWGGKFWEARAYMDLVAPRSMNLMPGKAFAESIAALPTKEREGAIVAEVSNGNIPPFQRKFVEIHAEASGHKIVYEATPDYFALGTDEDFIRMPLTPGVAKKIADSMNCVLPTRKMVNDIYARAEVKIEPKPMTQSREAMRTFIEQNDIIQNQLAGKKPGPLVAGHKKDIVVTNRLKEKPNRVAIYGWHKPDGKPIQPLTIVHGDTYVDYSHGVRLIKNVCSVDGKAMKIADVLKDPQLCDLLSDEGVIDVTYALPATTRGTTAPTQKTSSP